MIEYYCFATCNEFMGLGLEHPVTANIKEEKLGIMCLLIEEYVITCILYNGTKLI